MLNMLVSDSLTHERKNPGVNFKNLRSIFLVVHFLVTLWISWAFESSYDNNAILHAQWCTYGNLSADQPSRSENPWQTLFQSLGTGIYRLCQTKSVSDFGQTVVESKIQAFQDLKTQITQYSHFSVFSKFQATVGTIQIVWSHRSWCTCSL